MYFDFVLMRCFAAEVDYSVDAGKYRRGLHARLICEKNNTFSFLSSLDFHFNLFLQPAKLTGRFSRSLRLVVRLLSKDRRTCLRVECYERVHFNNVLQFQYPPSHLKYLSYDVLRGLTY
jgi:hypothetical protein